MIKTTCEICEIELKISPSRDRRNRHHTCSKQCMGKLSSMLNSRKIAKPCSQCKKIVYYKKSAVKDKLHFFCSRSCQTLLQKQLYKGRGNPRSLNMSSEDYFFYTRTKELERRARIKKLPFDLDYKDLLELYRAQRGTCHYSQIPLPIKNKGPIEINSLSVDRVDSSKGYTKDNVVLCSHAINMFKSRYSLTDIKTLLQGMYRTMSTTIEIKLKKQHPSAVLPRYMRVGDAGMDLTAVSKTYETTESGRQLIVYDTGISVEIPPGYVGLLFPRSSICKTALTLSNSVGVIDSGFRSTILFKFAIDGGTRPTSHGAYQAGDRVGQLLIIPYPQVVVTEVFDELSETERGQGGFGSTGN